MEPIPKLSVGAIPAYRTRQLARQGGKCSLCDRPPETPCLDHDHGSGMVRGVLCRGCNAMLGHLENNRARHGLLDRRAFTTFVSRVGRYVYDYREAPSNVLHPTFKTDEEKRLLKNKRARTARAKAKQEQNND